MSKNRAVRSSQKFKPTKNKYSNRQSKDQNKFKSREKPKFKSGAKPNNRVRDSGRDEARRRPSDSSKDRRRYRSSNRSSNRYDNRNRRDSGRGKLELHTVTCDKCKKETQVPFKPTGVKPVYCRECFQDQKPNDRSRSARPPSSRPRSRSNFQDSSRSSARYGDRTRSRPDGGSKQLHTVTCSKCKKETQVPFKPTGVKPVYCRECFRDQKPDDRSRSARQPSSRPRSRSNYRDSKRSTARYGDRTRSRPDGGSKQLHTVTCSKCKKETQVPFKPTGVKPVYCRECFQDQQLEVKTTEVVDNKPEAENEVVERFGDREGPYRATKRMHITTCRTCNKEIMIPFKPKNKPIYCQDCYQKIDNKK